MIIEAGRTAFITGGGGGIGLAIGTMCAEAGMQVVLADVDGARLEATLKTFNGAVLGVVMDVSSPQDWQRAKREAETRFGAIDLLANNAAIAPAMLPLVDITVEQFDRLVAVNLRSVFYGTRTFAGDMCDRGRGHILNTASQAGLLPMAQIGDYVAAKYAVVGLSETLRMELAPSGVGVSVLIPGLVRTNMTVHAGMDPIWVGRAVLAGIRTNQPYIFSHPNCREALLARHQAMMACIGEYAEPGYTETMWEAT